MQKIRVTLKKSAIGVIEAHRKNLIGLGLKRINDQRDLENTPAVRGMVKRVLHMVDVEMVEVEG